jgi:deoxyribodipyrimidine photo-lyase
MASCAVVVFTRDLRIRDNPALSAAARGSEHVVPLFVLDDVILGSTPHGNPNRVGFLLESLRDLDRSLHERGSALVVRRGDWVAEVLRTARSVDADAIHVADDCSGFATARLAQLEREAGHADIEVYRHPGVTVVPPDAITPEGSGAGAHGRGREMKVFTPYYNRWRGVPWRSQVPAPRVLTLPPGIERGEIPKLEQLTDVARSPEVAPGGETEGLARFRRWTRSRLESYDEHHDDLAGDGTSRISPYLHLGCLSPLEVASRLRGRPGGGPFVRQLCWRDFYHQVLAARPDAAHEDYRPQGDRWHHDDEALVAWKEGRTGYPIVDAGMRQLQREGWMHNRARLVTASFLTKDLYLDWRLGAAHFMELLVDGDVANNQLNWQWVAGTGNDTNRYRVFNPMRQAERFDTDGVYVRRYVDELAGIEGRAVHDPSSEQREATGYPERIVDHADAVAAYRNRPH